MDYAENIPPALSPVMRKFPDEDSTAINQELSEVSAINLEQSQPAKTEKGSNEEGFCCVMSMHDGVVL